MMQYAMKVSSRIMNLATRPFDKYMPVSRMRKGRINNMESQARPNASGISMLMRISM
jgi:hypothetical protein